MSNGLGSLIDPFGEKGTYIIQENIGVCVQEKNGHNPLGALG